MKVSSHQESKNVSGHQFIRCPEHLWKIAVLAVVFVTAAVFLLKSVHVLVVDTVKKGEVLFVHMVRPGDKFSTGYIHSVELSPVQEFFRIDDQFQIILHETTFCSSNVGLPYAAFGQEVFHTEPDKFRISNMHRVIPELLIWANQRYGNKMEFHGVSMALYCFEGDTLIRVCIEKVSLAKFVCTVLAVNDWNNSQRVHT